MSFSSIVTVTKTFLERAKGVYVNGAIAFGAPDDELRLRANVNKKNPSFGIIRSRQYDVVSGTSTTRVGCNITVNISAPAGVPAADIDVMVSEIAEFVTPATLSRLLQGEN